MQVIAIPDDDEKCPSEEDEDKKNGEEPMEVDKPSNGETDKDGENETKSPEGGEETKMEAKTEGSEVKAEDPEVKGNHQFRRSVFALSVLPLSVFISASPAEEKKTEEKTEKMDTSPAAEEKKGEGPTAAAISLCSPTVIDLVGSLQAQT